MPPLPHILIAEDHDNVRALLARVVIRTYPAVTITTVVNGALALDAYRAHGADLLITNHNMPVMSGIDLIRVLHALQASIPILMVSSDPTIELSALATGATRFLLKPFVLTDLQQTLIDLLPR